MSALLPCPFCGGEAASYRGKYCSSVKCDNGHAIHVYAPSLEDAIAAWNARAPIAGIPTDQLSTLMREVREVIYDLRRIMLPVCMTLAEQECVGEEMPDDAVLLSFMGSGASDQVTAGEFRAAFSRSAALLAKLPVQP